MGLPYCMSPISKSERADGHSLRLVTNVMLLEDALKPSVKQFL